MLQRYGVSIGLLCVLWGWSVFAADESPGKPVLVEGTWTSEGPRTILGAGSDRTITLKRSGEGWTITFVTKHYAVRRGAKAPPRVEQDGPHPVRVEDQEMVISKGKDGATQRYTFLCSPERLILPAVVQKEPGRWEYRSPDDAFSVRCEHDPFEIPVGKAQMPGVLLGKGFYSYEEAPRSPLWPRARYLRFLERSDEAGQLVERFRLIFDEYGRPRYERLLGTGERSTDDFQIAVYHAPQDER